MKAPRNLIGSCPMKGTEAPCSTLPRCCVDCQGVAFGDLCPHSRPFKPAVHVLQEFLADHPLPSRCHQRTEVW